MGEGIFVVVIISSDIVAFQSSSTQLCFPLCCSLRWASTAFSRWQQRNRTSSLAAAVTACGLLMARPLMHIACPQLSHTAQWDPQAIWEESSCYYLSARIQSITSYTTVDH